MSTLIRNPIIFIGAPRSGTTIISLALMRHFKRLLNPDIELKTDELAVEEAAKKALDYILPIIEFRK